MREGTRKNGIRLFDIDDPEQGISHVVAPELGIVLPGATHAVPDSHASTVGGVGALAFGCGASEMTHILATQVMALKRPKRMRARLEGQLGAHVSAKDVALRLIADLGVAGARGYVVEYAGSAVRAMPIEQRMTLCNLNIEMGGRSGFVAPDDATFEWLARRPYLPQGAMLDRAMDYWRTLASDDDAAFDRDVVLDCGALEPQITWGTDPSQVVGISGCVPESAADRSEPARRGGKRLRLYGPQARNAARRPASQSRLHRLLHQQPAAGPRSRCCRCARTAGCRGCCRHGGAWLVHSEARSRGGRA